MNVPTEPVPISLQTLTVLLSGAALGPLRGGLAMSVYLIAGVAGVPWFALGNSGIGFPTLGYIVGFVVAATVVGWLARRGLDRTFQGAIAIMVLGNLIIYVRCPMAGGGAWYRHEATAVGEGAVPLPLIGDALKILLAAGLLPAAWWLVGDRGRQA